MSYRYTPLTNINPRDANKQASLVSMWRAHRAAAQSTTGARVLQTSTTSTTFYPNKFYSLASTIVGSTTYATSTNYIWSGDTLLATIDQPIISGTATGTPITRYIHPDHLGSTNAVTDQNGNLVQLMDYYPYGATRVSTSTFPTNEKRQYIGQFSDSQTSLDYLQARYYDSARGQFVNEDPVFWGDPKAQDLTNPQSQGTYSYSADNPITSKDPSSLRVELVSKPIGDFYGLPIGDLGAHAFVFVIPDNPNNIGNVSGVDTTRPFALSGIPTNDVNGRLLKTANDPTDYFYGACGTLCPAGVSVTVSPPKGVSSSQFDKDVVSSYNALPADLGPYFFLGAPRLAGHPNSNNAATAILTGAGVSQGQVYQYRQALQDTNNRWTPGLGTSANAQTYYQQVLNQISSIISTISGILNAKSSTNNKKQ